MEQDVAFNLLYMPARHAGHSGAGTPPREPDRAAAVPRDKLTDKGSGAGCISGSKLKWIKQSSSCCLFIQNQLGCFSSTNAGGFTLGAFVESRCCGQVRLVPDRCCCRHFLCSVVSSTSRVCVSVGISRRLHGLPLWPYARSSSATPCALWRPSRRRTHWHRLLSVLRRSAVGLCFGPAAYSGFHASYQNGSSTGRSQSAHHGRRSLECCRALAHRVRGRSRAGRCGFRVESHVSRPRPLPDCMARAFTADGVVGRLG